MDQRIMPYDVLEERLSEMVQCLSNGNVSHIGYSFSRPIDKEEVPGFLEIIAYSLNLTDTNDQVLAREPIIAEALRNLVELDREVAKFYAVYGASRIAAHFNGLAHELEQAYNKMAEGAIVKAA